MSSMDRINIYIHFLYCALFNIFFLSFPFLFSFGVQRDLFFSFIILMYIGLASVNVLYVKSVFFFFIVLMYIELASINVLYAKIVFFFFCFIVFVTQIST